MSTVKTLFGNISSNSPLLLNIPSIIPTNVSSNKDLPKNVDSTTSFIDLLFISYPFCDASNLILPKKNGFAISYIPPTANKGDRFSCLPLIFLFRTLTISKNSTTLLAFSSLDNSISPSLPIFDKSIVNVYV